MKNRSRRSRTRRGPAFARFLCREPMVRAAHCPRFTRSGRFRPVVRHDDGRAQPRSPSSDERTLAAANASPVHPSSRCWPVPVRRPGASAGRWRSSATAPELSSSTTGCLCICARAGAGVLPGVSRTRRAGRDAGAPTDMLDGELICLGADGKPDFASLRARLGRRGPRAFLAASRRSPVWVRTDA